MIILYIYFKRFFLNLNGLSDGKVVLLTKKEYGHLMKELEQFVELLFYVEFS